MRMLLCALTLTFSFSRIHAQLSITGDLKQYHKTTLTFTGLNVSEAPGTFLNYRMNVTFTSPGNEIYVVPGYFAADGDAANTSATSGDKWRVHINPDEIGVWSYVVSFRTGTDIAVSSDANAGSATSIDGTSGTFTIAATDKTGNDFRAHGKLQYVDKPYAQFADGTYFYEIGSDSPETFLEYGDFDATVGRHTFEEIVEYQDDSDPTWAGGKGIEIMSAVNYMASRSMNVQYFLTMNINGDGKEAFPFPSDTEYTTYDVSKLAQWQIVFDHMYNKGMIQEFALTEDRNSNWFEEQEGVGLHDFSTSRKLYYRELIARFGYLNVIYNIGEEANWENFGKGNDYYTAAQVEEAAAYIQALTPYTDLISIHNGPNTDFSIFSELTDLSGSSSLTCISLQGSYDNYSSGHDELNDIHDLAQNDGTNWVIRYTEPYYDSNSMIDLDTWTERSLWASLTAGGAGIHYNSNDGDISEDNYRLWKGFFLRMHYAKEFLTDNAIPFWNMSNDNDAISRGSLLSDGTDNYIVFLAEGGTADIDLPGSNNYIIKWFDPRNGCGLQDGSITSVNSGSAQSIGDPPNNPEKSWVVFIKKNESLSTNEEQELSSDFKIFPNPTTPGYINISGLHNDRYALRVFDISGRLLDITTVEISDNNQKINMGHLNSGIYILKFESSTKQAYSQKLVIK
ncbi:hypothetical protein GCM10022260_21480 [Gaetbulibacter aestuarii]